MSLYNDYRPKQFNQVLGQPQAIEVLKRQIANNGLAHSYLFSGASGTGKTTTARILAARLVCSDPKGVEPCGQCPNCQAVYKNSHWDVIEINAADFRGIDDIRNLIFKAHLAPMGKAKVYILDECHMLSREAINCLLKLLEEPPPYLTIILATSEPEALPQTLTSRCIEFTFNKLSPDSIGSKMAQICQFLGFKITSENIAYIVNKANGNCRTAENILQSGLVKYSNV